MFFLSQKTLGKDYQWKAIPDVTFCLKSNNGKPARKYGHVGVGEVGPPLCAVSTFLTGSSPQAKKKEGSVFANVLAQDRSTARTYLKGTYVLNLRMNFTVQRGEYGSVRVIPYVQRY